MADPYFKRTPYGWCLDHNLEKSPYDTCTWQKYVKDMENFLNTHKVNYSVVHYKYMVRVHVYFSAIKKMGFKEAVKLSVLDHQKTDYKKLFKFHDGPTYEDIVNQVKAYFRLNDLPIEE